MDSLDPLPDSLGNDAASSGDNPTGRDDVATGAQEEPNPFWSERASDEFRLQRARPLQLAEFDDRQLDPGYESDTGLSGGFISAVAPSIRVASPIPARGSETSSEARHSVAVSNAPSGTSRSRSPMREELPGVRELLVSLGNAVAGLAEEQRNTQRRLAVVEEIRSGSSSSMRTGREGVEVEVGQIGFGCEGMGTQFFQIGDVDPGDCRNLRSGVLTLEDWAQPPLRLEDISRESRLLGPVGVPESYGPALGQGIAGASSAQAGPGCSALGQGIAGASSAQAGPGCSALGLGIAGASSAQAGPGCSALGLGIAGASSAQAGPGCSALGPGIAGASSAQAGPGCSALGQGIAGASSAQAGPGCSANGQGITGARSAQVGPGCSALGQGYLDASQILAGSGRMALRQSVGQPNFAHVTDPFQLQVCGFYDGGPIGTAGSSAYSKDTTWPAVGGGVLPNAEGLQGQRFIAWVDGVPRTASVGHRGIEVGGVLDSQQASPFEGNVGHPFVHLDSECGENFRSPPPPPPPSKEPLRFSPMTPNGTRIPKGPPPADSMVWPDWSKPMGETGPMLEQVMPPPALPPELQKAEVFARSGSARRAI